MALSRKLGKNFEQGKVDSIMRSSSQMRWNFLRALIFISCLYCGTCNKHNSSYQPKHTITDAPCDRDATSSFSPYFKSMKKILEKRYLQDTCIPAHKRCGWPRSKSTLPLLVFAVGAEGSGHHMWQSILTGVIDCVWVRNV